MKFSLLLFSGSANHNSKDWLDNIEQQTLTAQESGFDGIWGAGGMLVVMECLILHYFCQDFQVS